MSDFIIVEKQEHHLVVSYKTVKCKTCGSVVKVPEDKWRHDSSQFLPYTTCPVCRTTVSHPITLKMIIIALICISMCIAGGFGIAWLFVHFFPVMIMIAIILLVFVVMLAAAGAFD